MTQSETSADQSSATWRRSMYKTPPTSSQRLSCHSRALVSRPIRSRNKTPPGRRLARMFSSTVRFPRSSKYRTKCRGCKPSERKSAVGSGSNPLRPNRPLCRVPAHRNAPGPKAAGSGPHPLHDSCAHPWQLRGRLGRNPGREPWVSRQIESAQDGRLLPFGKREAARCAERSLHRLPEQIVVAPLSHSSNSALP